MFRNGRSYRVFWSRFFNLQIFWPSWYPHSKSPWVSLRCPTHNSTSSNSSNRTLQAKEAVSVASTPFPTIKAEPDANDQEVAMVNTQLSTSSSNGTTSSGSSGFISCSSSSYTSSRPHSAGQMSLTPLSSSRSSADAAFDEDDEASCSSRTGTPLTERIFVSWVDIFLYFVLF